MNVLLFGATGFLGNEVTKLLTLKKFTVFTVSRNDETSNYIVDLSKFEDFEKLPNDFFDCIINCATVLPGGNFLDNDYLDKIYKTNILGTQNICKWIATQNTIKHIVNCSTLVVAHKPWKLDIDEEVPTYPHGNHVLYCSSKLMQELIFQTLADVKKIKLTQVRFSALYGKSMAWNGIICNLIDQARTKNEINLTNGAKVFADFLNVCDAAKIIMESIKSPIIGILNAASGHEISLVQLSNLIANKLDIEVNIKNSETENFIENRAKINISKLKKYVDTSEFISIEEGIIELLKR